MDTSPAPLTLVFRPITPERYDDMLDILPPALETGLGFLMGEPMDYRVCRVQGTTRAAYSAFVQSGAAHFQASAPMTAPEFRRLTTAQIQEGAALHARIERAEALAATARERACAFNLAWKQTPEWADQCRRLDDEAARLTRIADELRAKALG